MQPTEKTITLSRNEISRILATLRHRIAALEKLNEGPGAIRDAIIDYSQIAGKIEQQTGVSWP